MVIAWLGYSYSYFLLVSVFILKVCKYFESTSKHCIFPILFVPCSTVCLPCGVRACVGMCGSKVHGCVCIGVRLCSCVCVCVDVRD